MKRIKFWIIYKFSEDKGVWKVHAHTTDKDMKEAFQSTRKMCKYKIVKHVEVEAWYNQFVSKYIENKLMMYEGNGIDTDGNIFHFNIPISVIEYGLINGRLSRIYMGQCHLHGFSPIPPFQDEYRSALADLLYYAHWSFAHDRSELADAYSKSCYIKNTWNVVLDEIGGDLI